MTQKTALYDMHTRAGAKLVDFAGWQMPIHYGSQLEEHHQVRTDAGMFDVSHMTVVDLKGVGAKQFLQHLLANDVARLKQQGKALYSCMLNVSGGVVDDLIVYYINDQWYRMVVNAATHDKDMAWINQVSRDFDVTCEERADLAMIAVQGPAAREQFHLALGPGVDAAKDLKPFNAVSCDEMFVARTGYTGEDGYECILKASAAAAVWTALAEKGVKPIGLGARDTLRLEAGMNLYGQDMDETTSPLVSGLAWTIAWEPTERAFIGRAALDAERGQAKQQLVGLVLEGRGVLRPRQPLYVDDRCVGETTSGSFSPTLKQSIALARIVVGQGTQCAVEIRGQRIPASIVNYPFVRNGKACFK